MVTWLIVKGSSVIVELIDTNSIVHSEIFHLQWYKNMLSKNMISFVQTFKRPYTVCQNIHLFWIIGAKSKVSFVEQQKLFILISVIIVKKRCKIKIEQQQSWAFTIILVTKLYNLMDQTHILPDTKFNHPKGFSHVAIYIETEYVYTIWFEFQE